jgi:hypothetical protein
MNLPKCISKSSTFGCVMSSPVYGYSNFEILRKENKENGDGMEA